MFNQAQLDIVQACAQQAHQQQGNEMSVYVRATDNHGEQFSAVQRTVLLFCTQEVERQQEGPLKVPCYLNAWNHAILAKKAGRRLDQELKDELAEMIEPQTNKGGAYRRHVITIGGLPAGTQPEFIAQDMARFYDMLNCIQKGHTHYGWGCRLTVQGLYEEFEKIHPRTNGNGREGKIDFNWLNDTLENPQLPQKPAGFHQV